MKNKISRNTCLCLLDIITRSKLNERNIKLCTKVDYFLFGHKLSWATAHFVRCNGIKMQSKEDFTQRH